MYGHALVKSEVQERRQSPGELQLAVGSSEHVPDPAIAVQRPRLQSPSEKQLTRESPEHDPPLHVPRLQSASE
jgi:hypothetical protein